MAKKHTGDGIDVENAGWHFGEEVAKNFQTHVQKSVPLYEAGHELIVRLSDYFVKNDSICYELGASVGTLSYKLAKRHTKRDAIFYALEKEPPMVKRAKKRYKAPNLHFVCQDITTFEYEPSDFIVAYYTIQFIHPKLRQQLINAIYQTLNWGGAFILYEKVRANDARFQDIISNLYMEYKLERGYSPDEIVAKSQSLKGVLEPFSTQGNIDLLKRAGFEDIITIQKYMNFEGFLAIK